MSFVLFMSFVPCFHALLIYKTFAVRSNLTPITAIKEIIKLINIRSHLVVPLTI